MSDDCFDREQIELLQANVDAPLPEQLEIWREGSNKPIQMVPFSNDTFAQWRDEPQAIDSADFDPQLIGYEREQRQRLFLERYDKPKELTEHH